jgi:hypothetical protein
LKGIIEGQAGVLRFFHCSDGSETGYLLPECIENVTTDQVDNQNEQSAIGGGENQSEELVRLQLGSVGTSDVQ